MGNANLGTVGQPLVGGSVVPVTTQEELGLVTVTCGAKSGSGCLLRNDWVITAAHVVDSGDPIQVTANFGGLQHRSDVRVSTFPPYDIAIIQVNAPFAIRGSNTGYSRLIFQDGQFPYFGHLVGVAIAAFGRGIHQLATATAPSQMDGQFRVGFFRTTREEENVYVFPSQGGAMVAGGDSGGPSFAWVHGGWALVGVHSGSQTKCVEGKRCGKWRGTEPEPPGYNRWEWVEEITESSDAPVMRVWDRILAITGPPPEIQEPATVPPPTVLTGEFGAPIPTAQPAYIYAIGSDGLLHWLRHDGAETGRGLDQPGSWSGPAMVGNGWANNFKDILVGDSGVVYGMRPDGSLQWYRHNGFVNGQGLETSGSWGGPREVGVGWEIFHQVFSGGWGIIYAITTDGHLLWYRHHGSAGGVGLDVPGAWSGPVEIGTGWRGFKHVFSAGQGVIYAITNEGVLRWYRHTGFLDGAATWKGPYDVSPAGWNTFRQVFSSGLLDYGPPPPRPLGSPRPVDEYRLEGAVIYGTGYDGKLWWHKHVTHERGFPPVWRGPIEVSRGWHDFDFVFALLPGQPPIVR